MRIEKLQNKIFKKMSAEKKLKICFQLFELGKKLAKLNDRRRASYKNRRNFRES